MGVTVAPTWADPAQPSPPALTNGMQMSADTTQASLRERIHDELIDSVEEELELEIDDDRLAAFGRRRRQP
jgi:hypothetical protein